MTQLDDLQNIIPEENPADRTLLLQFDPDSFLRAQSTYSQISEILLWYEKTWAADRPVSLEAAVERIGDADKAELFEQLLKIDLVRGAENNCRPPVAEYVARFPRQEELIRKLYAELEHDTSSAGRIRAGREVGHYKLLERLGQGGMGIVYKAFDAAMERPVAIKYLTPRLQRDREGFDQFQVEMKLLGRLPYHENIVQAFACDSDAGNPYFVMDYIDGIDLCRYVAEKPPAGIGRPLLANEAADVALQVARGLSHIHRNGMIHRDIKPSNIMIGADGRVRLCDLGLGLFVERHSPIGGGNFSPIGTPGYIAPETEFDGQTPDAKSDMYSLGVTLFFLLTARPLSALFGDDSPQSQIGMVSRTTLKSRFRALGLKPPPVPLLNILRRMTARCPKDRYASMAEVVRELEKFCPSQKKSRRQNRWAALLFVSLAAMLGLIAFFAVRGRSDFASPEHGVFETRTPSEGRAESLDRIRRFLARNQIQEAETQLRIEREQNPSDPEFFFLDGKIKLRTGEYSRAEEALGRAIGVWSAEVEENPSRSFPCLDEARYARALTQIAQNRNDEGIDTLTDLLEHSKLDRCTLLLTRGIARSQAGRYSDATADFDEAIQAAPTDGFGYQQRAAHWFRYRRFKRALADVETAIACSPDSVASRFLRGILLLDLSRYREALVDFDFLIKKISNAPFLYGRRAFCYEQLDDDEKARTDMNRMRELMNSDHPTILVPGEFASATELSDRMTKAGDNIITLNFKN